MTEKQRISEFLNWLDRRMATLELVRDEGRRLDLSQEIVAIAQEQLSTFSERERAEIHDELRDWMESAHIQHEAGWDDARDVAWVEAMLSGIIAFLE